MRVRRDRAARIGRLYELRDIAAAEALMALRAPAEQVLSTALRRAGRRCAGAFERLGEAQARRFLIAPTDLPVAFQFVPHPTLGEVRVVRRDAPGPFAARIDGPLPDLLALFDGTLDADAAFFSRRLQVSGETAAVLALHNALEAADLGLADLLGLPFGRGLLEAGLGAVRRAMQARPASEAA